MTIKYDFKEQWPKIKKQLMEFGQETLELTKKGEEHLIRLSRQGKLRIDATTKEIRKEQLYYLIGKTYVKAGCPGEKNTKLKKIIDELRRVNQQKKSIRSQIKSKAEK